MSTTTHPTATGPVLSGDEVWRELSRAAFAVISYVTPAGEPRSSGVVYVVEGRRMYVVSAVDSWKAKQIIVRNRRCVPPRSAGRVAGRLARPALQLQGPNRGVVVGLVTGESVHPARTGHR